MIQPTARCYVIGISGASCSGKSWLAQQLHAHNPQQSALFDLDAYYKPLEVVTDLDCQHDNPAALDLQRVAQDLQLLKSGQAVRVPLYDFETHAPAGERLFQPVPVIVVEGLFIYAIPELRELIDCKFWVEASGDIKRQRRFQRDIQERGRDEQEVRGRYEQDVLPGYIRYIQPLAEYADGVLENNGFIGTGVSPLIAEVFSYLPKSVKLILQYGQISPS